jgi:hypothetical protein
MAGDRWVARDATGASPELELRADRPLANSWILGYKPYVS